MLYEQRLGPGARVVYTTAQAPGPVAHSPFSMSLRGTGGTAVGERNRALIADLLDVELHWVDQVHSNCVVELATSGGSGVVHGQADGLVIADNAARLTRRAPAVLTADCVPVAIADESGGVRAAVHAGRRGLLAGVIGNALAAMRRYTHATLYAAIGPHICARCYEVDAQLSIETARTHPESRARTRHGAPALNLTAMARVQLERAGARFESRPAEVRSEDWCTLENDELFSYRRDQTPDRLATIVIRAR